MKRKLLFIVLFPLFIVVGEPLGMLLAPTFGTFSYIGILYLLALFIGFVLWIKYIFDLIRPFISH